MTDPRSFGAWLQRERERREIPMRAIADRTKIGTGLLQSLERGDVSRWPGGIYRRSFVRAYADAIGLDAELVLANFERLFPDTEPLSTFDRMEAAAPGTRMSADAAGMRIQLASPLWPRTTQLRTIAIDCGLTLLAALLGLVAAGAVGFWSAAAIAALACHVCTVLGLRRIIKAPVAAAILHWTTRHERARELVEHPEPQSDPALDLTFYAR